MNAPVICIDGPSGSGKGTVARSVADALGWRLLDSGALYRLVALAALEQGVDLDDGVALAALARALDLRFETTEDGGERVLMDEVEVSEQLRLEETGEAASQVAAQAELRDALLDVQRAFRTPPGLVADGRDMGTVVFPDAELKIYLTASAEERAQRRHKQLIEKGLSVSLSRLFSEVQARDRRDSERSVSPLRPAEDAVTIDSTSMDVDEVVADVLGRYRGSGSQDGDRDV